MRLLGVETVYRFFRSIFCIHNVFSLPSLTSCEGKGRHEDAAHTGTDTSPPPLHPPACLTHCRPAVWGIP
jgi:hypothetical protein